MKFPVVQRFEPKATRRQLGRAEAIADAIAGENPALRSTPAEFQDLVLAQPIEESPTLQLADFSEVPVIGRRDNSIILQQRARLRAGDGDWVALSRKIEAGFSDYCEYDLGLGRVNWIYPAISPSNPLQLAFECWQDRRVRHDLVQAIRHGGLRYIHPHVSTLQVWELAYLLTEATRMPLHVIGPTPAVAQWANNKIEFTQAVERMFGKSAAPRTEVAYNFATLSQWVHELSQSCERIGIKFPYGTGGNGNFLIHAADVREMPLLQLRSFLKNLLSSHSWPKHGRLLIDVWETNVIGSPSVQTWIPPMGLGDPVIEGVFEQRTTGQQGAFVGSVPAELPPMLEQQIVDQSFQLTWLFQRLGYVGRCSFDLILVGEEIDGCRVEFIESNARWGGTSIPMSLMNRLGIPEQGKTYCVRRVGFPGLDQIEFAALIREFGSALWTVDRREGNYILFNPARLAAQSAIEFISIGRDSNEVNERFENDLIPRLTRIIANQSHRMQQPDRGLGKSAKALD